jgi:hypothetical protein
MKTALRIIIIKGNSTRNCRKVVSEIVEVLGPVQLASFKVGYKPEPHKNFFPEL